MDSLLNFIFKLAQSALTLQLLGGLLVILLIMIVSTHWEKVIPFFDLKYAARALFILLSPLALMAFFEIFNIVRQGSEAFGDDKRGYTILLAALAGAPFVIWRTWIAQKQGIVAEQGHMTDRISKAVEQLGVEKTTWGGETQKTEPNLEVRLGAIYALERISQDSLRDHISVMEILCAYVRNNAPVTEFRASPHEVSDFLSRGLETEKPLSAEAIFTDRRYVNANPDGIRPTDLNEHTINLWAKSLPDVRSDVQSALTVIGRRTKLALEIENLHNFKLDLSKCNLQKATLKGNFSNCNFESSRFDGATLSGSFDNIDATTTSWQAARAPEITAKSCQFLGANLNYSYFSGTNLDNSDLRYTSMKKTNFNSASLKFTDWYGALPNHVFFFEGADASGSRFQNCNIRMLNGIKDKDGVSKNLFVADKQHREWLRPNMLFSETISMENERDFFNAWQSAISELKKKPIYSNPRSIA